MTQDSLLEEAPIDRIRRRLSWAREWHKLERRPFVDRDGEWGIVDLLNEIEMYLPQLPLLAASPIGDRT